MSVSPIPELISFQTRWEMGVHLLACLGRASRMCCLSDSALWSSEEQVGSLMALNSGMLSFISSGTRSLACVSGSDGLSNLFLTHPRLESFSWRGTEWCSSTHICGFLPPSQFCDNVRRNDDLLTHLVFPWGTD